MPFLAQSIGKVVVVISGCWCHGKLEEGPVLERIWIALGWLLSLMSWVAMMDGNDDEFALIFSERFSFVLSTSCSLTPNHSYPLQI